MTQRANGRPHRHPAVCLAEHRPANVAAVTAALFCATAQDAANPDRPLSVDEDKAPLAITAAVIDPDHDNLPAGPVTPPDLPHARLSHTPRHATQ